MAKLKIMSIELAAPKSRKTEVLDYLQRKGAVELGIPEENENFSFNEYSGENAGLQEKAALISSAGEILKRVCSVKKPVTSFLEPRKDMSTNEYMLMSKGVDSTLKQCGEIIALDKRKAELNAEIARLRTLLEALEPWQNYDDVLKAGFTEKTAYVPGSFRGKISEEKILSVLSSQLPEIKCVEIKMIYSDEETTCIVFFVIKEEYEEVENVLRGIGFVRPPECENTPARETEILNSKIFSAEKEIADCDKALQAKAELLEKIEFASDFLSVNRGKFMAMKKIPETGKVFYVKGYIAERDGKKIASYIEKHFDAAVRISEPAEDEDVPVILSNGFFAAPLENITGMYSLPGKSDTDPTGVMAFFYYFFFGMMLSDAGYGLLMALATGGALLFKKNLEKKTKNTLKMYLFCGLSTVFWGAMYGSWFGDMINVIRTEFLELSEIRLYIWMEPVDNLMELLVYCFLFGLVHLFVGVAVKALTDWKNGDHLGAFCDSIPTYLTILGMAPIFFGLFTVVPEALKKIGTPLLIVGLALVVLTGGRSSKSIGGKIGGGLYEVYNLIGGYLGDVLSYARLLALGLSTGVIANVMNMLGVLPNNKALKLVMFICVAVIGHAANFGINLIGAYVHTNRLQYVEFFGKFYEGGGRAFIPFEAKTAYYKFKEEN